MLSKKKKKAVVKKSAIKKPKAPSVSVQIANMIVDLCENNDSLFLYDINSSYAFILKRIPATTFYIQNEGLFCPVDKYTKKEFCAAFYIVWGDFDIPAGECDFGIPALYVKTPEQAEKAILSYDGETIEA